MARDTVLITGASSGIGLETAVYLAEQGFHVYATMRDLRKREALDAEAQRRNVHLEVLQLDITDTASIEMAIRTVIEQSGSIYGLVNNAGTATFGYFEDIADAELRQVFETNLFGTMAITRAILPYMRTARRGRIIFVTSLAGKVGAVALSTYSASKFAVEGFGEALALEMAPLGVKVSIIEPTAIKTDIWDAKRHVAQKATEPASPYYALFHEAQRLYQRWIQSTPTTANDVAQKVQQALQAKRPRLRYVIGNGARIVFALRRYLPGESFEHLYFGILTRRLTRIGVRGQ